MQFSAIKENNEIEINDNHAMNSPETISKLLVDKGFPPKHLYVFTEDLEMYFLRTIRIAPDEFPILSIKSRDIQYKSSPIVWATFIAFAIAPLMGGVCMLIL